MPDHTAMQHVFNRDGYLVIQGFYDVERDIAPIKQGIQAIVAMIARNHGVAVPCDTPDEAMTVGYCALAAHDRSWAAEVYDAVKQIPAFSELVAMRRNAELFAALRPGSIPGLSANGAGIRIDNPGEERFRSYWHQEFPVQLRSLDGIVFWSPLLAVTAEMGPVELCSASHKGGLIGVHDDEGGVGRSGAYALRLDNEADHIRRYEKMAPLTQPGDLILMDFLTLHQSGHNRSDRPRWSMQFRYFNFCDPVGIDIGWKGIGSNSHTVTETVQKLLAEK